MDRKVKELRNKSIVTVKVLWKHHGHEEATWEFERQDERKVPRAVWVA